MSDMLRIRNGSAAVPEPSKSLGTTLTMSILTISPCVATIQLLPYWDPITAL